MLTSLLPPPLSLSLSPLAYLSSPFYFRATIQQYGEPQCQTVKKCIGMTPNTFKCIPVHAAPPAIIPTIASVPVAAPSSQEKTEKVYEFLFSLIYSFFLQCLKKWGCENAKLKDYCGSNGITFSSRCLWRRYKCIHKVSVSIVKGACSTSKGGKRGEMEEGEM